MVRNVFLRDDANENVTPMYMAQEPGSARTEGRTSTGRTRFFTAASQPPGAPAEPGAVRPTPEELLQRSEGKNRALLETISDLIFVLRKDGVVAEFHAPPDYEFTLPAVAVVGRPFRELLPSQIGQQAMYHLEKALRTGKSETFISQLQIEGRLRDFEARIAACGPAEALAVVRDVTDRTALEREIAETTNRVQARIGQDLHDGLGQHLTGITFLTRALANKLKERELPEADAAAEIGRLVMQALSQTRNLARGLFPVELEASGLAHALRELAANVQQISGIGCAVECDERVAVGDASRETHLFRLAQEAINNCVKHAKAKRLVISLKSAGGKTILSVADDGVGFSAAEIQAQGLGLRIMKYRAQKIGGVLEIKPGASGGTVVSFSFPNPTEAPTHENNRAEKN